MFASSSRLLADDENEGYYPFKDSQYYTMWAIGTFSSLLSLLGSCTTLYLIRKQKAIKLYHRLAFGLGVSDLISAIGLTMQPYLLPQDSGYPFAIGNQITCNIVGSLFPFCIASFFQANVMAIFLFLKLRYGKHDKDIQCFFEPWSYILAFGIPGVYTTIFARRALFNPIPSMGMCGVFPYPPDCTSRKDVDCSQGKDNDFIVSLYHWTTGLFVITGVLLILVVCSRRNCRGHKDPLGAQYPLAYIGGGAYLGITRLMDFSKYPIMMYYWWFFIPIGGFYSCIFTVAVLAAPWRLYHDSFCWVMRKVLSGDSPSDYQQQGGLVVQDYWGTLPPHRHTRQSSDHPQSKTSSESHGALSPSESRSAENPMTGKPHEYDEENELPEETSLFDDDVACSHRDS